MARNNDDKMEIKLNRKMRMWHKYRNMCFAGIGILAVAACCVAVFKGFGSNAKDISQAATEQSSQVVAQGTEANTQQSSEETTQEETTAAPKTEARALTIPGVAEKQDFSIASSYNSCVLIGDSIVEGISYYGYLDSSRIYSDGNNTISKASSYINEVAAAAPFRVFIMVGLNDVNYGTKSAQTIADELVALAGQYKSAMPSSNIYILSILPVTQEFEAKPSTNVTQATIEGVNSIVSTAAPEAGIGYIDVAEAFKDSKGYMKPEFTSNGSNIYNTYYPFILNGIAEVLK